MTPKISSTMECMLPRLILGFSKVDTCGLLWNSSQTLVRVSRAAQVAWEYLGKVVTVLEPWRLGQLLPRRSPLHFVPVVSLLKDTKCEESETTYVSWRRGRAALAQGWNSVHRRISWSFADIHPSCQTWGEGCFVLVCLFVLKFVPIEKFSLWSTPGVKLTYGIYGSNK